MYLSNEEYGNVTSDKENNNISKREGHTYKQWLMAILANCVLFTYGMQSGWMSPMTKVLKSEDSPIGRPLTDNEISWVGSIPSLAGVLGVPIISYIVEKYGRKIALQSVALLQLGCWVIKVCPSTLTTLLIARCLSGIAAGGAFNIVPLYVKEISQDDLRGTLGILMISSQNIGVLIIYSIGGFLDYHTVIWIVIGVPALAALLMFKAPESPAYLVKVGKLDEAAQTIATLRGLDKSNKTVQYEISAIQKEDERFKSVPNVSFLGIFKVRVWRKGFLIAFSLIFVHALNGAFSIVTYASSVLTAAGVTVSVELQTLSIPVFMLMASFVSMSLVDRLGRRIILAAAFLISTLTYISIASILLVQDMGIYVPGWMPVVAIIVGVACYAAGVGSIPFVIISEMFNFQIRVQLMCCLITSAWFISFFQLLIYAEIANSIGASSAFYGFGVINLLGFLFCIVLLPETKGKTVEEIERELGAQ